MYFKILTFKFLFFDIAVKITINIKYTDLPIQNPTVVLTTTIKNKHLKEHTPFLKNKNNEVVPHPLGIIQNIYISNHAYLTTTTVIFAVPFFNCGGSGNFLDPFPIYQFYLTL
jgi:hypothetical protein